MKNELNQDLLHILILFLLSPFSWFYTSDTIVREVSIDEVLSVPAYLLFYDRGQQRQLQLR